MGKTKSVREVPVWQESKPHASVGWKLPRKPDAIAVHGGKCLVFFGSEVYDLDAITSDITYEEFKQSKEVFK